MKIKNASDELTEDTKNLHNPMHENGGVDEISLTGLSGDPADTINESLLTTQNDIIVRGASAAERLNIAASRIVARLASGNIVGATAAEIATLIQGSIDHGSIAGLGDDDHTQYQKETDFTAGSVLFRGSSVITEDNSNLFWDDTNKVLGIGTNSPAPSAKLHIGGDIFLINSGGDPRIVLGDSTGAGNWGGIRWNSSSDYIGIGTSGANIDAIVIKEDGNVGIGVTDPDTKLEIFYAGNQLKLSFDGTDNAIFAVDTNGVLTITPSGAEVDFASKNLTSVGTIASGEVTITGADATFNDNYGTVFGTGYDTAIYYNNTNLVIDPDAAGSGIVLIGVTGDDDLEAYNITATGNISVSGTVDGVDVSVHATTKAANATLGHVIVETGSSIDVDGNGKIVLGDISAFLESTPTDNESGKAPDSNWAYDHAAATATHGVSGAIVGTSDSQALTNKSYNGLTLTSTTGTFTLASGKTFTVSNTLTLTATDTATLAIGGGGTLGTAAYTASTAYITHALADAANDFLVASSANTFAKQTLAATLTTLGKAAASGLASLNASTKVVEQPASITDHLDDTAGGTDAEVTKAPTSNVLYDHGANTTTAHGAVSAATASKHVVRDASARAKFAQSAAAGDAIVADANNRAPDSTLLEGSSKATVQDHTPKAHTLDSHTAATGAVDFNEQEATDMRIDNRTSDPGSPAEGQTWIRTDLA